MRPGQNRRMRNRNRKPQNPLTKTFESSGPDVKVRGTAQHIAEKYSQLSRDAHASGDPVAAENYLQHAEHYLRIILSAQAQYQQNFGFQRPFDDDQEDGGEEGDFDYGVQQYGAPQPNSRFSMPEDEAQPIMQTRERSERPMRNHDRFERPERQERQDRPERLDRPDRQDHRPERQDRRERFRRRREDTSGFGQQPVSEEASGHRQPALPAFLTTPIRTQSDSDEQPTRPLAHDLETRTVEAASRERPATIDATIANDVDKPAPRTRRRRIAADEAAVTETTVDAAVEVAPARRLRTTRTRRKSVDGDVPVGE